MILPMLNGKQQESPGEGEGERERERERGERERAANILIYLPPVYPL